MDEQTKREIMTETKEFKGFGQVRNGKTWAERLKFSTARFMYYAEEKGLTIEELYELRDMVFVEPKRGGMIERTRETMESLVMWSGYSPRGVKVSVVNGKPIHQVTWNGEAIGKYFYKEERLVLTNGEGLPLSKLAKAETLLVRTKDGWVWHPETKQALLDQIIGR